jgi:glycerate 2-kinase
MKIVIAPDSFKESLSALEAADAIEEGIKRIWPKANIVKVPMADGGEGSVQTVVDALHAELRHCIVHDPLGRQIPAFFAFSPQKRTAFIEMAAASGLPLLTTEERNPTMTSTYGTGELILAALDANCTEIYIGLGGSATVDGGCGALEALGMGFYSAEGLQLAPCGGNLLQITSIDASKLDPRIANTRFFLACDVDNPLLGQKGAALFYGSQKGASETQLSELELGMQNWAKFLPGHTITPPGSGAAGGLAAGLQAFLNAELRKGVDIIAELVGLDQALENADFVITGEGSINYQTIHGKTPIGIAQRAKCPVIALTGELGTGYQSVHDHGIAVCWPIEPGPCSKLEALQQAKKNLTDTAERLARTLNLTEKGKGQ